MQDAMLDSDHGAFFSRNWPCLESARDRQFTRKSLGSEPLHCLQRERPVLQQLVATPFGHPVRIYSLSLLPTLRATLSRQISREPLERPSSMGCGGRGLLYAENRALLCSASTNQTRLAISMQ